nr:cytochrome P450 [uncultured Actinoplanes sp.]
MKGFDPLNAQVIADPYAAYATLREDRPVHYSERLGSWVLTRYRDCHSVLSDVQVYASDWRRAGFEAPQAVMSMQELDPPEHSGLRRLFTTAFRGQRIDILEKRATAQAAALCESFIEAPSVNFTTEIAQPVALTAICDLLGVPEPPVRSFADLSDALVLGMDAGLRPELLEPATAARKQVSEMIATWHAAGRLPGLLDEVLAGASAAGVTEDAVWASARVLFLAAFSTTVGAAANGVMALLQNVGALERMRDPQLLDSGVDELMRFGGPVQGTTRAVVSPVEIDGIRIERGQLVLALIAAGNRDPEQFVTPDSLLLDRRPNRHLSLGWGPHACSGAMLARSIMRALIVGLLGAPQSPRLAGTPSSTPRATLHYPDDLPITFTHRSEAP